MFKSGQHPQQNNNRRLQLPQRHLKIWKREEPHMNTVYFPKRQKLSCEIIPKIRDDFACRRTSETKSIVITSFQEQPCQVKRAQLRVCTDHTETWRRCFLVYSVKFLWCRFRIPWNGRGVVSWSLVGFEYEIRAHISNIRPCTKRITRWRYRGLSTVDFESRKLSVWGTAKFATML